MYIQPLNLYPLFIWLIDVCTYTYMYACSYTCIVILAPEKTVSLARVFKKSYEYEEIQITLKPLLSNASQMSRGTAPQYNNNFPWQVFDMNIYVVLLL